MIAPVFICALLILLGPLFSLSLFVSYFPNYALLPVIGIQFLISKVVYFSEDQQHILNLFYPGRSEYGTKEGHLILGISAMTSWIAPCTVWSNRGVKGKQGHLISSALITLLANLITLLCLHLFVVSLRLDPMQNPPITHCFNSTDGFPNKHFFFSHNSSVWQLITFSPDKNMPKIRICSDQETPVLWLGYILVSCGCLCMVALIISIILYYMSDFNAIYKYLRCSNSFNSFVIESLLKCEISSKEHDTKTELFISRELKRGEEFVRAATFAFHCFKNRGNQLHRKKTFWGIIENNFFQIKNTGNVWKRELKSHATRSCKTRHCPPLHSTLLNGEFSLFILLYLMGGKLSCSNGQKRHPFFWLRLLYGEVPNCNDEEKLLSDWMREKLKTQPLVALTLKYIVKKHNRNAVKCAVKEDDAELLEILLHNGFELNVANQDSKTSLHYAVAFGATECLKVFIENQADVNARDSDGRTPLHVAARKGRIECLKVLLENQANVNARDSDGRTPLRIAAWRGELECLKILTENQADVNVKNNEGTTALHVAAMYGLTECLKLLIENRAEVNARESNGHTPLHYSAKSGGTECLKLLIANNADINAQDDEGETPLHFAARAGQIECLRELIRNQADVNVKDNNGKMPLWSAGAGGYLDLEEFLN